MKYMATRGVLRFLSVDFQKSSPMKLAPLAAQFICPTGTKDGSFVKDLT
jgi:hypothetical protein